MKGIQRNVPGAQTVACDLKPHDGEAEIQGDNDLQSTSKRK